MTTKSKLKRILAFVIAVMTLIVSVSAVNAVPEQEKNAVEQKQTDIQVNTPSNTITTYFHEETGTFIVKGTGVVNGLYPIDWDAVWPWVTSAVNNTTIKHVVIGEGITNITNSFNGLENLVSVAIPEGVTNISNSFMECTSLTSVDFPESLKEIAYFSFASCTSLKNITFKNKVRIFGDRIGAPFYGCSALAELNLPGGSSLQNAFSDCSSLKNVYIGKEGATIYPPDEPMDIEDNCLYCFDDCHPDLKLHYVEGTLECYDFVILWDEVIVENMPEKITLTVEKNGMNVNWDGKTAAGVYHIYRKAKGDKKWTKIADTELTYYVDGTVESGIEYVYLIKVYEDTDTLTSSYTRFMGAPVIKSATQTTTGINITWDKVGGATKYRIYRKTGYNGKWTKLADVTGTTYKDNKASSNVRYYYTVRAFGKTGYSDCDKSHPYAIYLKTPKITSVKKVSNGVSIDWEKVGCSGYYVYRKEAGGKWIVISRPASSTTNYVDKSAKKGVQYYYTVRSYAWDMSECIKSEYKSAVKFKY